MQVSESELLYMYCFIQMHFSIYPHLLTLVTQFTYSGAVYFGGVSEFSSIFLCISQLFQYYPPSSLASDPSTSLSTILHSLESFSQAMFVLTFFIFRIIGWAYYSYMFISDGLYVLKHDLLKRFSPGSGWFLLYLLSMAVLLGGLQLYWLGGIVEKLRDIHG